MAVPPLPVGPVFLGSPEPWRYRLCLLDPLLGAGSGARAATLQARSTTSAVRCGVRARRPQCVPNLRSSAAAHAPTTARAAAPRTAAVASLESLPAAATLALTCGSET
eukprot:131899-Chlamydomonas_euryale.AAC.1